VKRAVAALVVLAGLLVWLLWPAAPGKPQGPLRSELSQALRKVTAPSASESPPSGGKTEETARAAAPAEVPPGTTPPLAKPATAADGFVEVTVHAQGKPVAGAQLRLYSRGHPDRATGKIDWRLAGVGQTSAAGQARLPARPGPYLVSARGSGFAAAHRDFVRPAGEAVTKVTLELDAGLSLSGRTMQKGGKEPVPLALVTVVQEEATAAGRGGRRRGGGGPGFLFGSRVSQEAPVEEQLHASSDEQGRFHVDGLERGSYLVTAVATGFAKASERAMVPAEGEVVLELASSSFIEGFVIASDGKPAAGAAVIASGGSEPVTGTASDSGSFSLEVTPRTWELSAKRGEETGKADGKISVAAGATARGVRITLGPAASIAGSVVTAATQAPVPGAQVALSPHGADGASGMGTSDANGAFSISGLAPGSYDAVVSAQGFTDATYAGLTVEAGQKFPLRALLHQTGTIQGVVTDSGGRGVANALVRTLPGFAFANPGGAQPQEARADASGAYSIADVAAGHVQLTAVRDGSTLGTNGATDLAEGGTARLDFQLHDEGTLTGHVRRADGSPAPAGTTVSATPSDNRFMRADWAAIPVDATGAYVALLPAGPYALNANGATAPGRGFANRNFTTVEAGKTAVLDLVYTDPSDPTAGFSGTVLEPGGAPSPGAFVRGRTGTGPGGFLFMTTSDESGRFDSGRAQGDLPATFQVLAINGGRTASVTVTAAQPDAVVQLQPGATLNGHLASGPVDQFRVDLSLGQASFFGGAGPLAGQSLQFSGDHFTMSDVPGTAVQVVVTTQDGRSASQDVTLTPGGSADVEIPLQPLATVSGKVVDAATQAPVSGAMIFVDRPGPTSSATTGADGSFSIQASSGAHTLRGFAQGYQGLTQQFTAQGGAPVQLGTLTIARQAAQSGTIGVTLRGAPPVVVSIIAQSPADVAGLHVGDQIAAVDGQAVTGVTDATARITGAPGTPVTLTVLRSGVTMSVTVTRAP
jgi:hypothetical protein